jgi:prophage regulatory protein
VTTLLRLNDVMKRVPLRRTAIYAAIKAGTFPAPVKIGGANGASAWRVDELDAWLEKISAARSVDHASARLSAR